MDPDALNAPMRKSSGPPLGESSLCARAGVAGIYGVDVLEGFRGRGIRTAMVHAALQHARNLGYRDAVLSATGMGRGCYERLRFRAVCKTSFWKCGKMRPLRATTEKP